MYGHGSPSGFEVMTLSEVVIKWNADVVPERKPTAEVLTALIHAILALAKARIMDVSTLSDAWKILYRNYGNDQEIRAKLEDQVKSIKLKAI